ncbi:MAG: hypothetical protein WAL95_11105 [Candidatus Acidiferrales bacterium]
MICVDTDKRIETWRVLIARSQPDEILLRARGTSFSLPEIAIPVQERIAININRAVERELGLQVISLYEICPDDYPSPNGIFYHAAVSVRPSEPIPEDAFWRSIDSLPADLLPRAEDGAAVDTLRSLWRKGNARSTPEPFLRPDWFAEVKDWVEQTLRPYSIHLTGPFQQFNASSSFSLIRFETSGTPVWFKAVGEPNTREYAVTLALARVCPQYLPKVLGSRDDSNAWLAEEAAGTSLFSNRDLCVWKSAAQNLAKLQIRTLPVVNQLSRAGARNLAILCLRSCVGPFFEMLTGDSSPSKQCGVEPLALSDLDELRITVQNNLAALDDLALPQSVGHMDLNPRNIVSSPQGCVFLDWAESFTGCPFFSFEYLLQQFRQVFPLQTSLEMRFREAYVTPWRVLISPADLTQLLACLPLAALFAYATTLWRDLDAQPVATAAQRAYLLRLVRKMRRVSRERKGVPR